MTRDPAQYERLYEAVCRRLSIPPDHREDAKQEMRIAVMQGRTIDWAAIDFIRRWTETHRKKRKHEPTVKTRLGAAPPTRPERAKIRADAKTQENHIVARLDSQRFLARLWPRLTERERQVFVLARFGYKNYEIAKRLGLSEKAGRVSAIRRNIAAKARAQR